MQKMMIYLILILTIGVSINYSYSQEANLASFHETAQIVIDKSISQTVTASITLQSTSTQEIQIPANLEEKIRKDGRVSAIVFTNQNQCVLGVVNESCIMINVIPNPSNKGILEIQNYAKDVSQLYIDEINQALDTKAKFHSVFIHNNDASNKSLATSGIVLGGGSISAVYTLPMEDTNSMYEKISAILIPKIIRDKGGFYNVAKELSNDENSKMTFSILPSNAHSLLQLKLSIDYPDKALEIVEINPLEFFNVENIQRSSYFTSDFYPLNSIIQVIILSPNSTNVSDVNGNIINTQLVDDEKIPTELTKAGWIFDPQEGELIQGKYLFGQETSANEKELIFSLGGENLQKLKPESDTSILTVTIITLAAGAAALFYLKGYKK